MQRREQPGAAGAEDQNVGLEVLDFHGFQNTRTRKAKATRAESAAAKVASCFWPSRQSKFSITRMRNPPSRCTVNRNTRRDFGGFDQRLIAPAQKALQSRFALDRQAERQKVQW